MRNFFATFLKEFGQLFSLTPREIYYPNGKPFKPAKTVAEGLEMDRRALAGDWQAVGDDMRRAMQSFKPRSS